MSGRAFAIFRGACDMRRGCCCLSPLISKQEHVEIYVACTYVRAIEGRGQNVSMVVRTQKCSHLAQTVFLAEVSMIRKSNTTFRVQRPILTYTCRSVGGPPQQPWA